MLRISAGLWMAYLGVSAWIDYSLKSPGPVERFFYIADGLIAVFFIDITLWPSVQKWLGKAFLPLMIILICALPIGVNQILAPHLFPGPGPAPEAVLTRVAPFLLIALLLVAWQYKWQHIVVFTAAVAIIQIGILRVFIPADRAEFSAGLFAVLTQVVTFLVVGFFINILVGWLHRERHSLQEANSKLANYAQTLEDLAITRERSRIAQELHDVLSHTLSGISVQLETMKAYWDIDPATARKRLDKSLAATRSGLEDTRRILLDLRARPLEDSGLTTAIRQLAEEAAARSGMTLDMSVADNLPSLAPGIEQCFFRVAQEAITNAVKHSRAQKLTVKLEPIENKVRLTVQDNGLGFSLEDSLDTRHFGLLGMRERVEFVKGELTITSRTGIGTVVQLTV
jgi:signal transduction histidine kinase